MLKHNWSQNEKVNCISIRGGEPSLNPELPQILLFLADKANNIFLETNGTWIQSNKDLLQAVEISKVKVKLSLDKMHQSANSNFEIWLKILKDSNIDTAIAITEKTFQEFEDIKTNLLAGFDGLFFWHKKASSAHELIKPTIGVINIHGSLQKAVSNKLKIKTFGISAFIFIFILFNLSQFVNATEKVAIGIAANFSSMSDSTSNPYSNYFRNAINMAIEDNKVALQKIGIELTIQEFDYGDDKKKVIETAYDAVNSKVIGVIGYIYSSDVFMAGPIFEKNKLLLVTPTGSADRIEELGRFVRRTCFEDSFQGKSLANYAFQKNNIKKIGIVSVSDCAYCQSLSSAFRKQFEFLGGKVLIDASVLSTDSDFSKVINQFKNQNVDAILVPNYEKTSASIISALVDGKITPKYWLGGDGWGNSLDLFHKIIGLRSYRALTVSHWHPEVKTQKSISFSKAYLKKYNKSAIDTAVLAYDAANLMIQAILNSKKLDREGLINSIEGIKTFGGVTGKLNYPNHKRTPIKTAVILNHENGKFSLETIVGE